jgi:formate hydrogenlyase transcriptional activator
VIERLGSSQPVAVNVRVIAATHRDLPKLVADQTFREDLYYRLNVFPIAVPPLRERVEDIPGLVWNFIDEFSKAFGKTIESSKDSLRALQSYRWPGNVRELRNVIERAAILSEGPHLVVDLPKVQPAAVGQRSIRLTDIEADHIRSVLDGTGWRVRGSSGAAALLGMKPTTLESRMTKLGIRRAPR